MVAALLAELGTISITMKSLRAIAAGGQGESLAAMINAKPTIDTPLIGRSDVYSAMLSPSTIESLSLLWPRLNDLRISIDDSKDFKLKRQLDTSVFLDEAYMYCANAMVSLIQNDGGRFPRNSAFRNEAELLNYVKPNYAKDEEPSE
jgi:hypothetical protein